VVVAVAVASSGSVLMAVASDSCDGSRLVVVAVKKKKNKKP
jgi:hypothetical protein